MTISASEEEVLTEMRVIARGSQAVVMSYKMGETLVAAKKVTSLNDSKDQIVALKREAGILEKLNQHKHKNIVPFLKKIGNPGELTLIMPLFDKNLQDYLREQMRHKQPIIIEEVIWICREIADGVRFLHSKPIIHKDLKVKLAFTLAHLEE